LDEAKGNEMHIYWKNLYIWAKVTQVSDVARGPLVCYDQLAFKDRQDVTQ
jgi:hypothetical protein